MPDEPVGAGTSLGVIISSGSGINFKSDPVATTNTYETLYTLDTAPRRLKDINLLVQELGGVKGVTYRVQGSQVDEDADYVDVKTYLEDGSQHVASEVAVAAGAKAYMILPAAGGLGVLGTFRFYRMQAKSTVVGQPGSAGVRGFAK